MIVTIREIVRYFRDYPNAEASFKRDSHGMCPRAWVRWHIQTWAIPARNPVWREPQPARLWHWMREAAIRDDWALLRRMSPEFPVAQRTFEDSRTPEAEARRAEVLEQIEAIRAKPKHERTKEESRLLSDWDKQHGG